jgi:hypothetical protein
MTDFSAQYAYEKLKSAYLYLLWKDRGHCVEAVILLERCRLQLIEEKSEIELNSAEFSPWRKYFGG